MPNLIKKNGLSLMEVMITVAILLIVLGSLLYNFAQCLMLNEGNNNLVIALNDAQVILEQLRGTAFGDIATTCNGYASGTFSNLYLEQLVCTPTFLAANLIQIDVQISWSDKTRLRDVTLSTNFAIGQ